MSTSTSTEFTHATLPALGKRVLRLGLAGNMGVTTDDVRHAAERGVNYWLWGRNFGKVTPVLRDLLKADRDQHVVAFLGMAMTARGIRRNVDRALRKLDTDYLDIFKLGWLGRTSRFSERMQETLLELKADGKVRSLGCSIHDRPRAGRLAEDSILDTLMIRYNAKHPGAEQDIFPHLETRHPNVVAYTATSWQQLIKPLKNVEMPPWPGDSAASPPPLTAPMCYRFCLSSPHVHVVLTGPKNREQLDENLGALEAGPYPDAELQWVRDYGALVKRMRRLDYV